MNRLYDKFAILILCMMNFNLSGDYLSPVVGMLALVFVSSVVQLTTMTTFASCCVFIFSALCGVYPIIFIGFPLLLYDALQQERWWLILPAATVIFRLDDIRTEQLVFALVTGVAAALFYVRISRLEGSVGMLRDVRDELSKKLRSTAKKAAEDSEDGETALEADDFDFDAYGISDREREILECIAAGENNREIAKSMYLSEGTIRNYISSLLEKLELRDRTQLAVFYYEEVKKA